MDTVTRKDASGNVVQSQTMNYNTLNQLESITEGGAEIQSFEYDDIGRMVMEADRNGYTRAYTYDDLNRVVRTDFMDGSHTENHWSCCGVERVRDRMGRSTQFVHDRMKRLVYQLDPAGRSTRYGYDAVGNLTGLTDGNGNTTQWEYDAAYRMVKKTYADHTPPDHPDRYDYTYDGVGNLKTRTDANGVTVTYTYDYTNNLTDITAALSGTSAMAPIHFDYDAANRRTGMSDALVTTGTTSFAYDDAGQLASVDGPWANDTIGYDYDALGRETARRINGTANEATTHYDTYGRVDTVTNPLGTFGLTYTGTAATRLAGVTYPNGQSTAYAYYDSTGDERLQTIWNKGTTSGTGATLSKFDYEYDAEGNITKWTQEGYTASPAAYDFAYDPANELLGGVRKLVTSGSLVSSHGYTYDKGGNRTSEQAGTLLTSATHNAVNQVTAITSGTGTLPIQGVITNKEAVRQVTIAANSGTTNAVISSGTVFAGKANVHTGTNVVTVVATDGAMNSGTSSYNVVVTGTGSATLSYDANGNLLADGTGRTYEWTVLDQLAAINQGTNRTECTYDGLGRRVRIVEKENGSVTATRNFVWTGMQIAEERDAANAVVKRFYAQGMKVEQASSLLPAGTYYYTRDHLGSIREMTDASRAVMVRYDYDPYGRQTRTEGSSDADFGYTGHFTHAASGLALAPFRAYNAGLGRWLSRDPLVVAEFTQGPVLYSYVNGNPLARVDKTGLYISKNESNWDYLWLFTLCPVSIPTAIGQYVGYWTSSPSENDRYWHCTTSCSIVKAGGNRGCAKFLGWLQETHSDNENDSEGDLASNRDGRDCAAEGPDVSCECCCRKKGHDPLHVPLTPRGK